MRALIVIGLLVGGAAWAKKPKAPSASVAASVGPAAPVVPAPVPPGPGDGLLFGVPGAASSGLDLGSLQRTRLEIGVSLPALASEWATPGLRSALETQLAADPRWRLVRAAGGLVAVARQGGRAPTPNATAGVWAILRLDAWPADSTWATSSSVARVGLDAPRAVMVPATVGGGQALALSVGKGLGYDVLHIGTNGQVALVTSLEAIGELVGEVAVMADLITAGQLRLPAGEPSTAPSGVTLTSPGPGLLRWEARINAGRTARCWLRLMQGGAAWEERSTAAGTAEIVGGAAGDVRFYAEGTWVAAAGPSFAATGEVWCETDAVKKVWSGEVGVPAR